MLETPRRARPDDGLLVRGRHQPVRHGRDPRSGEALRLGGAARRSSASSTTTWSSSPRSSSTSIEFVADKIPWVDSIWDAVHTVDPADRRRGDCRRHARRREPDDARADRAARRHARRRHAFHEGGHARRRQHQPRAVLELAPQPRRRHLRHRPLGAGAEVPDGRRARRDPRGGRDRCSRRGSSARSGGVGRARGGRRWQATLRISAELGAVSFSRAACASAARGRRP